MLAGANTTKNTSNTADILNLITEILNILKSDNNNIDKSINLLRPIAAITNN